MVLSCCSKVPAAYCNLLWFILLYWGILLVQLVSTVRCKFGLRAVSKLLLSVLLICVPQCSKLLELAVSFPRLLAFYLNSLWTDLAAVGDDFGCLRSDD